MLYSTLIKKPCLCALNDPVSSTLLNHYRTSLWGTVYQTPNIHDGCTVLDAFQVKGNKLPATARHVKLWRHDGEG